MAVKTPIPANAPRDGTVTVEYTARGKRERKTFPTPGAAKRFYAAKYAAGAEPKLVPTTPTSAPTNGSEQPSAEQAL